jgi:hypothetical protein
MVDIIVHVLAPIEYAVQGGKVVRVLTLSLPSEVLGVYAGDGSVGLALLILDLRRGVEFEGVGSDKVLVRLCMVSLSALPSTGRRAGPLSLLTRRTRMRRPQNLVHPAPAESANPVSTQHSGAP